MQDVNTAWKMASGVVIMCFVMSIGLSILWMSKAFWNRTETQISNAVVNTADAEIYQLASQGQPQPVAAMWKCIAAVTPPDRNGNTTLGSFTIYEPCTPGAPDDVGNGYREVCNDYGKIMNYMAKKGYLSYEEKAGLYYVTIHLAK